MPKKQVKGTTENLSMLNSKIEYIGFTLGEVPEFLKDFKELNYKIPKTYDETTYKVYKAIPVDKIDIMITPSNRLDELEKRYKYASPIFTYMKPETDDDLEKYAKFLKMINQTQIKDIEEIEIIQNKIKKTMPFTVKYPGNYKWQIYYSEHAKRYFMLASTEEMDNSPLFYLLKKKIQNEKKKIKDMIFVPISNEEYSEKILKKSEIADLENYLWFFTKTWPSIYEVTDENGKLSVQITGEATIYDDLSCNYNIKCVDKKEAQKVYKLIKALFILGYDEPDEFEFQTQIDKNGQLYFSYDGKQIEYDTLPDFMKEQAICRIKENIKTKVEIKNLEADIIDLKKHAEEKQEEYLKKERQIYTFLECKKTFLGKVKYFFKSKKVKKEQEIVKVSKDRLKGILNNDKQEEKEYDDNQSLNKMYTVEDIIKICKELNENTKKYKNLKLDIKALNNKIENLDRKIKNATQYLDEIEEHKKSIFEFWKFANKDEVKSLQEGEIEGNTTQENLKRIFDYDKDIEVFANEIDSKQRKMLNQSEFNATFAANFVLDGINILSKSTVVEKDEEKIKNILENLKVEYQANIEKIQEKDFDIFGNVNEDKTKLKLLNNNTHREIEKDKFKILNVNLDTELKDFIDKLIEIKDILKTEENKIQTPMDLYLYKASTEKLSTDGFEKFALTSKGALENVENTKNKTIYLYKINIPEGTNLIFYSNIIFFDNNNKTLPLGMDISQETLIDLDSYNLELLNSKEINTNVSSGIENKVRKIKIYEYEIKKKN